MTHDPATTRLYHITDVSNLPAITATGGLLSDVALGSVPHQVIGYDHIKRRRMTAYRQSLSQASRDSGRDLHGAHPGGDADRHDDDGDQR